VGGKGGLRERDMTPKQERLYQIFLWKRKQGKLTPKEKEFFESLQTIKDEENAWKEEVIKKIEKICNKAISYLPYSFYDDEGYKFFIQDFLKWQKDRILEVLKNEEED